MKELRIGFIGAGFMAGIHAKNLINFPGITIAGVVSSARSAGNFAEKYPGCQIYPDYRNLINEGALDAVIITLPPFAHSGEVEYAAEKGVAVFIEKPIALNLERAESMDKAVRESGIIAQVGYHMRFGGAVKKLKEMIDNQEAGVPSLFDARYQCNSLHGPWWRDINKSGGQLLEQAIHLYDLSQFFLGEAESISAFTANVSHRDIEDYTIEDTSASAIRYKDGGLANISATNCAVPFAWENPFVCVCEKVTAVFEDANNARFIYTSGEEPVTEAVSCEGDMYRKEIEAFIDAVRQNKQSPVPMSEGFSSVKLVISATKSNGTCVKL